VVESVPGDTLPEVWPAGGEIQCRSFLFGIIPFGTRTIRFERIDPVAREIQSREFDRLIARWDHLIRITPVRLGWCRYRDEIVIEAGWRTLIVWMFAQLLYRHRQRKWRAVAKRISANIDLSNAHLRIARPTDNLSAVVQFYRDALGFEILYEFKDHDGFDGVMLGHRGASYHLEFTRKAGHEVGRAPTEDHLLVFYLPDAAEWKSACERIEKAGNASVPAFNPYWDRKGKTYEDPDGYRVVIQNASWPA